MQRPSFRDYLLLHICIIFWGFTSILGVLNSLESPYLVVYRTAISFGTLYLILLWRKLPNHFPTLKVGSIAAAGFLTALHWGTFFASAQLSNVSTCLAGLSTTALWTSILEPIFFKKKFEWSELILAVLVCIGLAIIYQSDLKMAFGLSISIASALACSVFTMINRNLVRDQNPLYLTTWEMAFALLSALLFIPLLTHFQLLKTNTFPLPIGWDWLNLLFLAWVCTVFAYTMSVHLMKRFTAFAMNLTVNLEPVYGIVLGLLIFGQKEKMQPTFYIGLILILGGVFLYPILQKKSPTSKNQAFS